MYMQQAGGAFTNFPQASRAACVFLLQCPKRAISNSHVEGGGEGGGEEGGDILISGLSCSRIWSASSKCGSIINTPQERPLSVSVLHDDYYFANSINNNTRGTP